MKTLKNLSVFILIAFLGFTSCKKENTTTSEANSSPQPSDIARTVTSTLQTKIDGYTTSPTTDSFKNALTFDYCFTFVYPITLSYNNGTQVVVADAAQLLSIVQSMTSTQYIVGIAFPFDAITANGQVSITNEQEFADIVNNCDLDQDGTPNYQDNDTDGDTVSNNQEDLNQDGNTTNDDTDGDATPNCYDTDDDNDGINTIDEDVNGDGNAANDDSDGDGIPNCQDTDDDNDGVNTADEDNNHDGNVSNDDSDNDGTADYLDTDSDNDGIIDGQDSDADGNGVDDANEGHNDNDD